MYAFRYRGINAVGQGAWSDLVLVRAATIPIAPPAPYYISSTATTITLGFLPTEDNQGSKITRYSLLRDSGDLQSGINVSVSNYYGHDSSYTVSGLSAGLVYRFTY